MQISSNDYTRFKKILEKHSGILLSENKQYLVSSRLSQFIQKNQLDSFKNLLDCIELDPNSPTASQAIELMTTNETLWFRDKYPFDYLKNTLFPIWKQKNTSFKILSAACSSGQEAYSVAMLLERAGLLDVTRIIATDLSSQSLAKAKMGFYQKIETERGLSETYLSDYFTSGAAGWQIKPNIRHSVDFRKMNLLETPYNLRLFDIIFCRNVLIYFSNENKAKVLKALLNCLKIGGYLFLGASESPKPYSNTLKTVYCNSGIIYQKQSDIIDNPSVDNP